MADENQDRWCFAWFEEPRTTGETYAALVKGSRWSPGDVITVSFLDGDTAVQDRVVKHAQAWTADRMANLIFDFRDTTDTLIRISFKGNGSWSTIGTTCRQETNRAKPTMNFGWLTTDSTDDEVRRVVLHEFGHALGLIHEHQHPEGGIQWNKAAVYRDLEGTWSKAKIDFNLFQAWDRQETNYSTFDPKSIMMYPLSSNWTTNGFSVGLNSKLSRIDRKFIRQQYP